MSNKNKLSKEIEFLLETDERIIFTHKKELKIFRTFPLEIIGSILFIISVSIVLISHNIVENLEVHYTLNNYGIPGIIISLFIVSIGTIIRSKWDKNLTYIITNKRIISKTHTYAKKYDLSRIHTMHIINHRIQKRYNLELIDINNELILVINNIPNTINLINTIKKIKEDDLI